MIITKFWCRNRPGESLVKDKYNMPTIANSQPAFIPSSGISQSDALTVEAMKAANQAALYSATPAVTIIPPTTQPEIVPTSNFPGFTIPGLQSTTSTVNFPGFTSAPANLPGFTTDPTQFPGFSSS